MNRLLLTLFAFLCFSAQAHAQLSGTDLKPGDACTPAEEGYVARNASADRDVSEITLICDGAVWQSATGGFDTLASLSCANNEIAKWNGTAWACAADDAGSGSIAWGDITSKPAGFADDTDDTGITALTGDVTASGTGSVAATIANNAVTTAKINNSAVTPVKTDFVGTLSEGKWCIVSGGNIVCTSDAPSGGGGGFIPACKADMSNIQAGDTCDDGSKFLGSHPNFGWQGFYATDTNQSTSSNWSTAVTTCNNLSRHGHTDWYLPSITELFYLFEHQDAITGFGSTNHWSSTEHQGTTSSFYVNFITGAQNTTSQSFSYSVRCVRRN